MTILQQRRRRAHYRATHRGSRELDLLLGRYAERALPAMSCGELSSFERLLTVADPTLYGWIMLGEAMDDGELGPLVLAIRKFHGFG